MGEGETVTLHTGFTGLQRDVQIQWFYGPVDANIIIAQSQVLRGEIITDYNDRFRDRLQLDRQTGSLTIRNINITDSGVYKLQIISGEISEKRFSFTVYATVPAPDIRVSQSHSAGIGSSGPKCSVECSVENGRDATLSWYKGKEILNQTSSPDLNTILSLPLEIEDQDNNIYSCVAHNPVSHQTTRLSKKLCPQNRGMSHTKVVQSQVLRGQIITDYNETFGDRLQLDRQTGSLTIRNINITDSGVYKVQIINGEVSEKRFSYTVYDNP
ncbi:hepatocyte cell adhesion molecule-like [Chanos chanos]|uniref:Hepatocyte cell adhesion molecule-like n=1 Tax=Chanos chanos TaxID=29144 RepID=A0A6J2WH97_CHACN|nr:hepatocyte cell adhesion molecule-like [Chanos chanos]